MPTSSLVDTSLAAFVLVVMVFLVLKIIDLLKTMGKKDPAVDLTAAINALTAFLREEKAAQKEINKQYQAAQDVIDDKLNRILDALNHHAISCQKCYNIKG